MYSVFLYIEIVNILMGRRQRWFGGVGIETQLQKGWYLDKCSSFDITLPTGGSSQTSGF